jgi:hypothetical protein
MARMRESAVARLQATGMCHSTAARSSALTSWSCGCGSGGSQKEISTSIPPSAMRADLLVPAEWAAVEAGRRQARPGMHRGPVRAGSNTHAGGAGFCYPEGMRSARLLLT